MQLIFATNNPNKVKEIKKILPQNIDVKSLREAGIEIEIPEPHDSLKENASEKSRTIFNLMQQNCFSEDTGLIVDALKGAPGVKSARYAGEPANDENNIDKLLQNLSGEENRSARFKTIISLIWEEKEYWFEGVCEGRIIEKRIGDSGFGYDPVFIPEGSIKTFAQMDTEEKNLFSHRKKAMAKLLAFMEKITKE
ncbi:RdgB/HAM1 family non-canonical purine NTP pyrophosphatase [Arachidicoccus soli]|uniref:dITP/XTP pyrophosphatase n=1 Tax=Arachidicoccus soli TaxID=2341117 RepID=A0A386HR39_9BACT|nr:RdgB/HAM1 family non-canonical purine NTP pyrophosphatase [Arachidicoccus soli]AYD47901.1 RdgB/HAM1 family non-canonical purine NTP pyrophosphatase [Arachidicoccus soli]